MATCAIATVAWLGGAASAFADDLPQPGRTTTTRCEFTASLHPARTSCIITTVVTGEPRCFTVDGQAFLLWDVSYFGRAIDYAGNVGTGEQIDGYYSQVRPNAKVLYDSGTHAYGVGNMIEVDSC